jgi:hypothetical protein
MALTLKIACLALKLADAVLGDECAAAAAIQQPGTSAADVDDALHVSDFVPLGVLKLCQSVIEHPSSYATLDGSEWPRCWDIGLRPAAVCTQQ